MVAETSIKAYHELVNSGFKFTQREKIFNYVNLAGKRTRRQIAMDTGLELGAVAGRVNKLIDDKIFEEVGTTECEYTGKTVNQVDIKRKEEQQELDI